MNTISFRVRRWTGALLLGALGTLGLFQAACDSVAERIGIDEVEVETDFASAIPVAAGDAQAVTGSVSREGTDLPNLFEVEAITIAPEDVSYTPAPVGGKQAGPQDSGNINVLLIINGYPAVVGQITITDDEVTAITPSAFVVGGYTDEQVLALYDAVDEESRPALASDWQDLSQEQIEDRVNTALRSNSFTAGIVAQGTDDLAGTLGIRAMTFELDF